MAVSSGILSPRKGDPGAGASQPADSVEAPSVGSVEAPSSQVIEGKKGGGASLGISVSDPSSVPGLDRAISGPSGLEDGGGVVGSPAPESGRGVVSNTVTSGAQVSLGSPPLLSTQSTLLVSSSKSVTYSGSLYGDDEALFSPVFVWTVPQRGTVSNHRLCALRLFPFLVQCLGLLSLEFSRQLLDLRPVRVVVLQIS